MDTGLWKNYNKFVATTFNVAARIPGVMRLLTGDSGLKNTPQGTATAVWALLTDELKGGEYCADCRAAPERINNKQKNDADLPRKLWEKTEEQLALVEEKGSLPEGV